VVSPYQDAVCKTLTIKAWFNPCKVRGELTSPEPQVSFASFCRSSRTPVVRRSRSLKGLTVVVLLAAAGAACDGDTPTTPTDTSTPNTTVAEPTITESFSGRIGAGGSSFYSFAVGANGTVNLTLTSVGGTGVPSTVWLAIGLGTPSGEDCSTATTVNTAAGTAVQLTGTYAPGVYCARVWDIGNLAAMASFDMTIAHP